MRCWAFLALIALHSCKQSPTAVGERIRAARLERQMSQSQLATAVGMSQDALSLVEDGLASPVPEKLGELEKVLGVELGE